MCRSSRATDRCTGSVRCRGRGVRWADTAVPPSLRLIVSIPSPSSSEGSPPSTSLDRPAQTAGPCAAGRPVLARAGACATQLSDLPGVATAVRWESGGALPSLAIIGRWRCESYWRRSGRPSPCASSPCSLGVPSDAALVLGWHTQGRQTESLQGPHSGTEDVDSFRRDVRPDP